MIEIIYNTLGINGHTKFDMLHVMFYIFYVSFINKLRVNFNVYCHHHSCVMC